MVTFIDNYWIGFRKRVKRYLNSALTYIKNNLIDSDKDIYLTLDSLIDTINKIAGSNIFFLKKVNLKPCGCDKMYMDKYLIENKLYQLVD